MARKKVVLDFPPEQVTKPIVYHLVSDYNLVINILRAEIHEQERGRMILDLEGDQKQIEKGIKFLKEQKVEVQEAARDITLDEEKCVDCGACTAVCLPQALQLNLDTWKLEFDKEKCVFCELCVKACPVQIIEVKF